MWEKLEELLNGIKNPYAARVVMFGLASPFILLLFILFIILGNWSATKRSFALLTNENRIMVKVGENVVQDAVTVTWNIDYVKPVVVYEKGENLFTDFNEYGKNYFTVSYASQRIARFTHFKREHISGHNYIFFINRTAENCYQAQLEIQGDYPEFTTEFLKKCP